MNSAKGRGRKRNFSLFILVTFILGCSPKVETGNLEKATSSPTPYSSPTAILHTPTPSAASYQNTIEVINKCLSVEDILPSDLQLTGTWVRQETDPYLEIIKENIKYRVPFDGHGRLYNLEDYWAVSPNGEWLAYIDTIYDTTERIWRKKGELLKVIHASGYFLSLDYWPMANQSIRGWVDDKNLLLRLGQRYIVLDPFSGKWQELIKPDWLSNLTVDNPWQYETNKYSPFLESVIVNQTDHFEIRDMLSGSTLFRDNELGLYDMSTWSPDASMLAVATKDETVISIFHNNEKILTLDLWNDPSLASKVGSLGSISKLEWSLNNQRLLINFFNDTILLLDIKAQKLYKACFDNEEINISGFWGGFLYSKTGQYIVVPVYIRAENSEYENFDVIIDTNTLRAYKLSTSEYNSRIGWLALPDSTEK